MLLVFFACLWYVDLYLLYVFSVVLFITSGKSIRIMILWHSIILTHDNITGHEVRLVFVCSTGLIAIA